MAKRSFYKKNNTFSARKMILFGIVIAAIGGAVWKIIDLRSQEGSLPGGNTTAQAAPLKDPEITLPQNTNETEDSDTNLLPVIPPIESSPPIPAVDPAVSKLKELLGQADKALAANDPIKARILLNQAYAPTLPEEVQNQIREKLNQSAKMWLFSLNRFENDPLCGSYKVVSGDNLKAIGRKYGVPYQFIMRINNIRDETKLRANQNIKVINGPFHAMVDKSQCVIDIYLGETFVCSYQISIGLPGRDTPTGVWRVRANSKLINPEWTDPDTGKKFYPDDPLNPLGERWIGLDGIEGNALNQTGFGIHGTIEPEKIGKPASRGCIRMLNKEVEVLYDMLQEGKSLVKIVE